MTIRIPVPPHRHEPAPDRRGVEDVLGIKGGASARGSTYWKRLKTCPREHALYHIGLRRTKPSDALDMGKLFHYALEEYFKAIQAHQIKDYVERGVYDNAYFWGNLQQAERAAWDFLSDFENEEGYEKTYKTLERILTRYFERYRRMDRWEIVAIEETLTFKGGIHYTSRLDLIVRDHADSRGVWIVEHKTARAITEDLLLNYQMDPQILGQVWLYKRCVDPSFGPLRGVLVDIITKHKAPQTQRQIVAPSKYHLANFEKAAVEWERLEEAYERLGWPMALGMCSGAVRYFKTCTYYNVCHDRPTVAVEDLKREFASRGAPLGYEMVQPGVEEE